MCTVLLLLEVSCLLWSVGVYCVMKSVLPVSFDVLDVMVTVDKLQS